MPKKKPPSKRAKTRQPKKEAFLAAYAQCGVVTRAAKLAGCDRHRYYDWLKDPEFQQRFDEAHEQACDVIETEIRRRAIEGVERPVFQGGHEVGVIREFSDTLLIFAAKGAMPEKYRERLDVSGKVDKTVNVKILQDEDWYGNADRLTAAGIGTPSAGAGKSGSVQGGSVRKAVGKNGNGTAGNGKGSRSK